MKLGRSWYVDRTALDAARSLLGMVLITDLVEGPTAAVITETEAYMGTEDRASHAFNTKRTKRNESMYAIGGTSYVYICYGIHHLFNVVVSKINEPDAVLIRAVHPLEGIGIMDGRRPGALKRSGGPGTLTQALGIRVVHDGIDLTGDRIWIEDRGFMVMEQEMLIGPRIGVSSAGDDALLPYRYRVASSHRLWK